MKQLIRYLDKQGRGARVALARACQVTPRTVSRWLGGERTPDPAMMTRIRRATDDAVPEQAWFE